MNSDADKETNVLHRSTVAGLIEKSILVITFSLASLWCAYGYWLFFVNPSAIHEKWSAGELGDFFGGGLGGLAIIGLVYTTWVSSRQFGLQAQQLEMQKSEMAESGVLRVYETLKPELEGISVRIISKLMKAGLIEFRRQDFDNHLEKFLAGDRTVFLRHCQKLRVTVDTVQSDTPTPATLEARLAIERFIGLMTTLDSSISKMEQQGDVHYDFCMSLKKTEVFKCYQSIKKVSSSTSLK